VRPGVFLPTPIVGCPGLVGALEVGMEDRGCRKAAVWDARAELEVGLMISHYLQRFPAPPGSRFAEDFEAWSAALTDRGRARLAELGARPLRRL
jgi:hypothetical protein